MVRIYRSLGIFTAIFVIDHVMSGCFFSEHIVYVTAFLAILPNSIQVRWSNEEKLKDIAQFSFAKNMAYGC